MNDQRPTRCPWSADSNRTGGSQSSMKLCRSGIRLCSGASARASSRLGWIASAAGAPSAPGALCATAIEHPLGVDERPFPAAQEDEQVGEDIRGLFVEALERFLAGCTNDLLGLLHHLLADPLRIVEQLD